MTRTSFRIDSREYHIADEIVDSEQLIFYVRHPLKKI